MAEDRSGWLEEICRNLQASAEPSAAHLATERQVIVDEQSQTQKQIENALAFIKKAGAKAPKYLLNEISKLERKHEALAQELAEKDKIIATATPVRANPDELRALFSRISTLLAEATPQEQQRLLRLFIKKIDVTKDGLVLHLYELPEEPMPPAGQNDMSSKTSPEWWAILESNQ